MNSLCGPVPDAVGSMLALDLRWLWLHVATAYVVPFLDAVGSLTKVTCSHYGGK